MVEILIDGRLWGPLSGYTKKAHPVIWVVNRSQLLRLHDPDLTALQRLTDVRRRIQESQVAIERGLEKSELPRGAGDRGRSNRSSRSASIRPLSRGARSLRCRFSSHVSSAESKVSVPSGQTIAGISARPEASGGYPAVAGSNDVGVIPGSNKMHRLMDAHVSNAL